MAFQHRLRRIVIGVGLILFAVCAVVATLYLYAFLLFVPGLFLTLSGCLDEFPDDEPEAVPHVRPFYARPWFLILATLLLSVAVVAAAHMLVPKIEASDHKPIPSPVAAAKDPDVWISQDDVADDEAAALVTVGTTEESVETYVLNTSTRKFHCQSCSSIDQMRDENREYVTGTRTAVADMGYTACKNCKP